MQWILSIQVQRLWRIFRTEKLSPVCFVMKHSTFIAVLSHIMHFRRLHMETKCGKHRSWHCLQCNLLTEQAYKQHMDTQHNEDVVITTKVEDTSHDNETIRPMENVPKADVIFASVDDPLLLELKEEVRTHEDSENTQNTMDESMDEVNESSEEDSSSEK